jgi:NAD(P)-dependent dehydrogenase (short-subunit alcohol dehydrogenase family)
MNHEMPLCAIVGAGPGNGAAFAHRFATAGYQIALLARGVERLSELASEIPNAQVFYCDVTSEESIATAFQTLSQQMGSPDVVIYNVGKAIWGDALSLSGEDFELAWRVNAQGAFLTAQQVLPAMREAQTGTIIFIGATASHRGGANTAAFAAAKAAQRSLAESLARAYGPDGVHVCLMIIDAVIDEPSTRAQLTDKPDSFFCKPHDIAETALMLTRQPPSAWTFELDLRPFGEKW